MNRHLASIATIALFSIASLAVAQDRSKQVCNANARECEQEIRRMLSGRRYLGLQVMELNPGLLVKGVVADSPAERADFRSGDRLMAVNGKSTAEATIKDFKQLLFQARETGKLFVIVQRRGALKQINVRLEPYSEGQIEKIIAQHLIESHPVTASTAKP